MDKSSVQAQFGANAAAYIDSAPHAKGASLARLVALLQPEATWQVLDVATAAGHTAWALAPHVAHVWATDITAEMLTIAAEQAARRGLTNVTVEYAEAEALPYPDARFDLVTCRIAPHHFSDPPAFVRQAVRVLRPGGRLAVVDNVVPEGVAGDYINAFEKLRDPSHGRCLTLAEWRATFEEAGLALMQVETLEKEMVFETWAARHDIVRQRYLRALLSQAGGAAAAFLHPVMTDERTLFYLQEGVLIGQKPPG